jgi:hypothetical protein
MNMKSGSLSHSQIRNVQLVMSVALSARNCSMDFTSILSDLHKIPWEREGLKSQKMKLQFSEGK